MQENFLQKIMQEMFMLKGHISSNFHGAGKFPTTNMKSFMVTLCVGFLQQTEILLTF